MLGKNNLPQQFNPNQSMDISQIPLGIPQMMNIKPLKEVPTPKATPSAFPKQEIQKHMPIKQQEVKLTPDEQFMQQKEQIADKIAKTRIATPEELRMFTKDMEEDKAIETVRKLMDAGVTISDVEELSELEQKQRKSKEQINAMGDFFTKNTDNINPFIRSAKGVLGTIGGAVSGLYEGVKEGIPEMIQGIKETVNDPNKKIPEKALGVLYKEVLSDFVANDVMGGTFMGGLEGLAEGFMTAEEREKARNYFANFIKDGSAVDQVIQKYKNLPEEERKEFDYYAGGLVNMLDLVPLGLASKPARQAIETGLEAGARTAGKVADSRVGQAVETGLEKIGEIPASTKAISSSIKNAPEEVTDVLAERLGGLKRETIETIKDNQQYEKFESGELSRTALGDEVLEGLKAREKEISELGSAYDKFRTKDVNVDMTKVKNKSKDILAKENIKVNKDGTLDFSDSRFAADGPDQKAIQDARKLVTADDVVNSDVALNRRSALYKIGRYGTDVSGDGKELARQMGYTLKKQMQNDIKGLKQLDDLYGPEVQKINQLLKDYIKDNGTVKDNFYTSIANIINRGKELKYKRIQELFPNLEESVKALQAYEDVLNASKKTGSYEKVAAILSSAGAGATAGTMGLGPLGGVLGGILGGYAGLKFTDPQTLVRMLKRYSNKGDTIVSKLENGVKLTKEEENIIRSAARQLEEQQKSQIKGLPKPGDVPPTPPTPIRPDATIDPTGNMTPSRFGIAEINATPLEQQLLKATDAELKALGMSNVAIKKLRAKQAFNKVRPTESATQVIDNQSIAPNASKEVENLTNEVGISKIDDALPVKDTMGDTTPDVGKLDDGLLAEARKYKTADEFVEAQTKKDYRTTHQVDTKSASPINEIDMKTIDDFISDFKDQYGYPALKSKEVDKLKKIIQNPDDDIVIYRASPKNELNSGDWVTIDKTYANDIKKQNGGKVYSHTVKARDLYYPNTLEGFRELPSLNKWASFQYQDTSNVSQLRQIREQANK